MNKTVKPHTPPKFLPPDVKKQWQGKYDEALKSAKINHPDDERAQHAAAHKAANVLLTVPAPQSAEEIDALPDWQVLKRTTKVIDGVDHRVVATSDGRKYAHPIPAAKAVKK